MSQVKQVNKEMLGEFSFFFSFCDPALIVEKLGVWG
jgi:hypothetical protein